MGGVGLGVGGKSENGDFVSDPFGSARLAICSESSHGICKAGNLAVALPLDGWFVFLWCWRLFCSRGFEGKLKVESRFFLVLFFWGGSES